MNMFGIRRVAGYGLLIVALLSTSFQSALLAVAQDQSVIAPPDRSSTDEARVVSGPIADAELDRPPAPDRAVVTDQSNPSWQTVYGTEAGRQLLPPRRSEVPAQIEGATPPLNGFWNTHLIQAGTQGVTADSICARRPIIRSVERFGPARLWTKCVGHLWLDFDHGQPRRISEQ